MGATDVDLGRQIAARAEGAAPGETAGRETEADVQRERQHHAVEAVARLRSLRELLDPEVMAAARR